MTTLDRVNRLKELGENNNTIKQIALYLECAIAEYHWDGDKIPNFTEEGKEAKAIIDSLIGCRYHNEINCQRRVCRKNGK